MKRILAFVLVVVFVFVLSGCGAKQSKKDIFNVVERNYDAIVTACENKDKEALLAIDGVTQVNIVDGYVLVYCKGAGIAPSSQDYGFYYSEDNSPVTVDCNLGIVCYAADLSPEGDGYQCIVSGNTFYTEHITGNIYFYSNAY
ncbi:MAG: hypothetical protein IJA45_07815 [Oscillospiraceae bacterium]|nr:hypothetical protein [Oscillospiraceae bacterium]